jgi:hypothetical protein
MESISLGTSLKKAPTSSRNTATLEVNDSKFNGNGDLMGQLISSLSRRRARMLMHGLLHLTRSDP